MAKQPLSKQPQKHHKKQTDGKKNSKATGKIETTKEINKKKPFKIRLFFSISIFAIIVVSGVISSAGIAILNNSGLMSNMENQTYVSMMISMGFSVIIGGILNLIWFQIILNPVCDLIEATQKVADGEYDTKVDFEIDGHLLSTTELGSLADSFNHMTIELSSTEMFRKDFISNFSHEFKTPIISICGFAEQIYKGNLSEEEQKEFAKIIMEESSHLAAMSSNILLLTKLENQDIVSEKTVFSLDEQIRSCMLLFEEQWSKKNLNIDMELEEIKYYQNQEMLFGIWKNLISNSVKYTPDYGEIIVKCYRTNEAVIVCVKDNGIGMDQETMDHIFDKFYQHDASHKTEGNGLGLSIVKRILILVGAKIEIESEPGQGSEFTVTLPLTEAKE